MYRENAIKDFCVGDFVTYNSIKKSTGGVIFRITEVQLPIEPTIKVNKKIAKYEVYDYKLGRRLKVGENYEETVELFINENGKKLPKASKQGFVRIKPVFEFFPAPNYSVNKLGMLIPYYDVTRQLKIVDTITLGTVFQKYQQFINMYVNKVMESD